MLKRFPLDKLNVTKNELARTDHSFTFNLLFLNELKHIVNLSKTVCRIFPFSIPLRFY